MKPCDIATIAGRVFVASSIAAPGRVDVLDAGSGRLLRTVAVGLGDHAVAVDDNVMRRPATMPARARRPSTTTWPGP